MKPNAPKHHYQSYWVREHIVLNTKTTDFGPRCLTYKAQQESDFCFVRRFERDFYEDLCRIQDFPPVVHTLQQIRCMCKLDGNKEYAYYFLPFVSAEKALNVPNLASEDYREMFRQLVECFEALEQNQIPRTAITADCVFFLKNQNKIIVLDHGLTVLRNEHCAVGGANYQVASIMYELVFKQLPFSASAIGRAFIVAKVRKTYYFSASIAEQLNAIDGRLISWLRE